MRNQDYCKGVSSLNSLLATILAVTCPHPCFRHNFQKIKNCAQTSGLKTVDEVRADLMVLDLLDHFFGNVGIAEGGIDEVFQPAATTVLLSGGNILD